MRDPTQPACAHLVRAASKFKLGRTFGVDGFRRIEPRIDAESAIAVRPTPFYLETPAMMRETQALVSAAAAAIEVKASCVAS